jgi:polyphosphate kinase
MNDPEALSDPVPKSVPTERHERYYNRELGLLGFQYRVLEEAMDPTNPLLERVKFLAILGSNLDEFFMVRVGGLIIQKRAGVVDFSIDGQGAAEQLAAIRRVVTDLMARAREHWEDVLKPALADSGIHVLDYDELSEKQARQVATFFKRTIFPVLTPQAVDSAHPFPHISNLSHNLAVVIRDDDGEERFAHIKLPSVLPQLVPLKRSSGGERKDGTVPHNHYFVALDQVVARFLDELFPGMTVVRADTFRVTRNADIAIQDVEATDLQEEIFENILVRQFSPVICLAVAEGFPADTRQILVDNLSVNRNDIYEVSRPLAMSGLMQLYDIDRYDLKYEPAPPVLPVALRAETMEGDIFAAIRERDILLHHPYESFDPVIEFLKAACRDPDVLAIKQTLYRVGSRSPVVKYLLEARREHRKQVTVLVELKARFDEESNIGWAKILEREGVHVVYGFPGMKTHAKALLVIRREGDQLRRYLHMGTGNYNHITARQYEDIGYLTCDEELGADLTDVFNYLTGYSKIAEFRRLMVAPINMRKLFSSLLRREIAHAKAGRGGHVIFKCNSLVDRKLIDLMYKASSAGVVVELIVRGLCSLRPGIPGLSDNITVRSILGRYLEHSRIYYFANGGQEEVYLGSADLMTRNFNHRVETLFPVQDRRLIQRLKDEVLWAAKADNVKARLMDGEGHYRRVEIAAGDEPLASQEWLYLRRSGETT